MSEQQNEIQEKNDKYNDDEKEVIINVIRQVRDQKLNSTRKNEIISPEIVSCVFEYFKISDEEFNLKNSEDQSKQIVDVLRQKFEWIKTIEMEFELHQIQQKENSNYDEKIENYNSTLNSLQTEILNLSTSKKSKNDEDQFKLENLRAVNEKIVSFVAASVFGPEIIQNEQNQNQKNNFTLQKVLTPEMEFVESMVLSVQPLAIIAQFLSMNEEEKKERLNTIQKQSLGVLLYTMGTMENNDIQVVNAGNVLEAAESLTQYLQNQIDQYYSWWNQLLAELQNLINQLNNQDSLEEEKKLLIQQQIRNQKKRIITLILFIRIVQQILDQFKQILEECVKNFKETIDELEGIQIQFGDSINLPRSEIMHKFQKVGEIQIQIIQIGYKLQCSQDMVYDIQCLGDELKPPIKKGGFFRNFNFLQEQIPENQNEDVKIAENVEILLLDEKISNQLELFGCCLMTFCLGGEILVPLKKELGVVKFQEKFYGFSSKNALNLFASDPENYIQKTNEILTKKSNILTKFSMKKIDDEKNSWNLQNILNKFYEIRAQLEFSTQTPTHFVEFFKDSNYEWNNWELRRRALAFANLRKKSTHSMQTDLSHFKRENNTQVWLPKQISSQTNYNKSTTMPKKLRYIGGLRGKPDTKMNIVSLDLDIDQSHRY